METKIIDTKTVSIGKALNFVLKNEDQLTVFLNFFLTLDSRNSKSDARGSDTTGYLGRGRRRESTKKC